MDKKKSGVSLVQYCIVVSLIALAIVPVYFFCGQQIKTTLEKYLFGYENMNNSISLNVKGIADILIKGNLKPGQLGGKTDDPVRECFENTCAIDYGNIVVNGIPANYSELVETAGTSGGTDRILSIMNNLVKQMEENPEDYTPDQVAKIKALIAKGKDIVNIEKYFEETMLANKTLTNDYVASLNNGQYQMSSKYAYYKTLDQANCGPSGSYSKCSSAFKKTKDYNLALSGMQDARSKIVDIRMHWSTTSGKSYLTSNNMEVPLSMDTVVTMLNPASTISYSKVGDRIIPSTLYCSSVSFNTSSPVTSFEDYLNGTAKLSSLTNKSDTSYSLVGEYINELQTINKDKTYDPALKTIANTLSKEIYDLSQFVRTSTQQTGSSISLESTTSASAIDTILSRTDKVTTNGLSASTITLKQALDAKPEERSRLDLGIICNSHRGEFNKDNVTCESKK